MANDLVRVPRRLDHPITAVAKRVVLAVLLVIFVALVVRLNRNGYVDVTGDEIGFLDAVYYASVTVTTTGYGDISAVESGSRLATVLLITPARILFLILVVSTTVEVLTEQSRVFLERSRWRKKVKDHVVVCGFGSTGQAAAADLLSRGVTPEEIVVVDKNPSVIAEATESGFVGVVGDATQQGVLHQAAIGTARSVIVAPNRDDTAVLITLTAREQNTDAHIVAGGREQENLHLLRQGGADEVVDATAAVGRMLGLGSQAPGAIGVVDDFLDAGHGLELVEVSADMSTGTPGVPSGATLIAVVRDGKRLPPIRTSPEYIEADDKLIIMREC